MPRMAIFTRKSKAVKEDAKQNPKPEAPPKAKWVPKSMRDANALPAGEDKPALPPTRPRSFSNPDKSGREEVFLTDPDAPPIPQPPAFSNTTLRTKAHPKNGDYFVQRSYTSPYYADSGYESTGSVSALHSRTPSEMNFADDFKQWQPRSEKGFLPELKLGEDTFSRKYHEGDGNVSPVDLENEIKSVKSNRSSGTVNKRTRFEDSGPDSMPSLERLQEHQYLVALESPGHSLPSTPQILEKGVQEASSGLGSVQGPRQTVPNSEDDAKWLQSYGTARNVPAEPVSPILEEPQARDYQQAGLEYLPKPLETVTSHSTGRRNTLPPLSILEGFKVNKKGRILDEEGDVIGELIEGDLLDCVRQKANAHGEVLDDYGRIVGTVRTVASDWEASTPIANPTAVDHRMQLSAEDANAARPALSLYTQNVPMQPSSRGILEVSSVPQTQTRVVSPIAEEAARGRAGYWMPEAEHPPITSSEEIMGESKPVAMSQASQPAEDLSMRTRPMSAEYAEQSRRPVRNNSERSLSELSKPWARPVMSSVPENNVPEEEAMPESPGLYAFKGEIPADDRPQREARSRSPHVAINPKAALALGQPNSAMFANMSTGPYGHGGRMGPRRATTQYAGSTHSTTTQVGKNQMNYPLRPSPLSSHETSPKRSENGDPDEGFRPPMHSRAASFQSTTSTATKTRVYFTHAGRITVDPNAPQPEKPADSAKAPAAAEKKDGKKDDKKKTSRVSMSFGKKK